MRKRETLENVVAQSLVAAGHRLFFYSRVDKEDYHNNIEIDFLRNIVVKWEKNSLYIRRI